MFQPEAKLQFVRRYCSPANGWLVYLDIDASEEGRTGGPRKTIEAQEVQRQMLANGAKAREGLEKLGVQVGKSRAAWFTQNRLPSMKGDRDIVAFHPASSLCMIAEVEGKSTGQPEQKLYKAIGQLVLATSHEQPSGWKMLFVLVVHGEEISEHLDRARSLQALGISALSLAIVPKDDRWLFSTNQLLEVREASR